MQNKHFKRWGLFVLAATFGYTFNGCNEENNNNQNPTNIDNNSHAADSKSDDQGSDDDQNSDALTDLLAGECQNFQNCRPDEICLNSRCQLNTSAICHSDEDCSMGPCDEEVHCLGGRCIKKRKPASSVCNDNNPCTHNDICNMTGHCQGQEIRCDEAPISACDKNNDYYISYAPSGRCQVDEQGQATCVYEKRIKECNGNCAQNCTDHCTGVSCLQDNSCFTIECDATLEGEGQQLCMPTGNKKSAGSSCHDKNGGQVCNSSGQCVECINDNQCPDNTECINEHCQEKAPECTVTACSPADNVLTICEEKKITATTQCTDGCNVALDNCGCVGGNAVSFPSNFDAGGMAHDAYLNRYCSPDSQNEVSYISCPGLVSYDRRSCAFFCGFQWANASGTSITGYGRAVSQYQGNKGGLYCTTDLNLPVSKWTKSSTFVINDQYQDSVVAEYISTLENLSANTNYYCAYISSFSDVFPDDPTIVKDVYYICPPVDHDTTKELYQGILLEPNTKLGPEMTRQVTTGQ